MKILIVDDSTFTRAIHKQIVSSEGHDVIEAQDGTTALMLYDKERPDVVLVDLLMPDMDGMELVTAIKERDPKARIVICSTDRQKFRQQEAKSRGVDDFLTKPVDKEKLRNVLRRICEDSTTIG